MHIAGIPTPKGLARQIWLNYFNDYLFKRRIITEEEWRTMRRRIEGTCRKGV